MVMNTGAKLYKKNKKKILGGNMLLSKNPEMILPDYWPAYYKKSNGINIWDLSNNKYLDMMCYVGQNTLGYNNSHVDKSVTDAIKSGNMTTLNSYEEIKLSELLIELHPWAQMAKFCRSGGEANALAIRIARAAAKKENIAICGYHGWHDWYLSVNLKNKNNLNDHLLPGLVPLGVPKKLANTAFPFKYGDIKQLKELIKKKEIGIIKMEVGRSELPNIEFLKEVRNLATKNKIVLIFDECTSGFRRNLGGLHMITGVYPDISMFGKALGNGYAITAVIGRGSIMSKANNSFISSTFWSERIGFVAALATINFMKKNKTWKFLISSGKYLNEKWKKLSQKYELPIKISGIESITQFNFNLKDDHYYKNFITQEMLKKKILATNLIFLNINHNRKIIDKYIKNLEPIFEKIKHIQTFGKKKYFLKGKKSKLTFSRLTD